MIATMDISVPLHIPYDPDIPYLRNTSTPLLFNKISPPNYENLHRLDTIVLHNFLFCLRHFPHVISDSHPIDFFIVDLQMHYLFFVVVHILFLS